MLKTFSQRESLLMYPITGRRGNAIWSLTVVFLLVFILAACGGVGSSAAPTSTQDESQPALTTDAAPSEEHSDEADAINWGSVSTLAALPAGQTVNVLATINIVGDVVRQIGGETIVLTTLIPASANPHAFAPTPQDVAAIAEADVVFINGLGLEEFFAPLIENSGIDTNHILSVSDGIEAIEFADEHDASSAEEEHDHGSVDPHVWLNPLNVRVWADNIAAALSALDPANASTYATNAAAYQEELELLDADIQQQAAQISEANRKLVTDHDSLGYFADRYGFEVIGAIIPAYSSAAQPSAQELAALQEAIQAYNVPAVFVDTTVNPQLAEQLSRDTGIQLVPIYTGSLSEADGPAATYVDMMRYNVNVIVSGLSE
jgi:ABC-type Zn uptake system ZnuABC Zn-binding protein ZnuA